MNRQVLHAVGLGVVVLAQSGASAAAMTSNEPALLPALSLGGDAEDALTLDADLT